MIPTPGGFLRVGLLVVAAVVLQISGVGQIRLLGGNADLTPLLVAAVALYAGAVSGAAMGFAVGLMLDLALGEHIGASSLVLTGVGYAVGRFRELRDPAHSLAPIPVGAAATACYVLASAAVNFMLSVEAEVSVLLFREMIVTVLLNAIIALPVFALVRRVLRSVLVVDPADRRRRRRPPRDAGPLGLRGLGLGGR